MKDLLNKEVKVQDVVAYVYQNDKGRMATKTGTVISVGKKAKISSKEGIITVKNVIVLETPKKEKFNFFNFLNKKVL